MIGIEIVAATHAGPDCARRPLLRARMGGVFHVVHLHKRGNKRAILVKLKSTITKFVSLPAAKFAGFGRWSNEHYFILSSIQAITGTAIELPKPLY